MRNNFENTSTKNSYRTLGKIKLPEVKPHLTNSRCALKVIELFLAECSSEASMQITYPTENQQAECPKQGLYH